jgi:hypothetical protein
LFLRLNFQPINIETAATEIRSLSSIPNMKPNLISKLTRLSRALLLATAILSAGVLKAQNFFTGTVNGVTLGNAATSASATGPANGYNHWAIFALSGGVTLTDPSVNGNFYDSVGDVGVGGAGNLTMSNSQINGNVYYDSGTLLQNNGNITGTALNGYGSYLTSGPTSGVTSATNASTAAAGLAGNTTGLTFGGALSSFTGATPPTTIGLSSAASISGAASTTYVLNLTNLIMSGVNAVLTLNGSSTTNYVVNVSSYMTLSSQASIVLGTGGITAGNILFNVKNASTNYDVTLSGGATVNGIILGPQRNVKLTTGAVVYGEVIGRSVSLSGASQVIVSP